MTIMLHNSCSYMTTNSRKNNGSWSTGNGRGGR